MVTAATREQLQRVNDPDGLLVLLMLEHPSMETARVVNDTRDWVIDGTSWIGLPFRFKLPNSVQGEAPRAQLEIDNVGRALIQDLERLPPGGALQATVYVVSRASPTVVDYMFTAPLSGVSATVATVTGVVGNDDALRAPAVKMRFDPTTAPGLFAG
ncbi:MAG: DUF1833 family protein [Aquincola tertiaricarbonis]|uniref:DUF1833 family protein n=1 Tax=Aquincola tertiaricarbonis TaxID=391953 RepID=UPI000614BAE2|nr:DUF1833 family protein [Aquincola tertiaricarbonis]